MQKFSYQIWRYTNCTNYINYNHKYTVHFILQTDLGLTSGSYIERDKIFRRVCPEFRPPTSEINEEI